MKLFQNEIQKFHNKLISNEKFSLARFGDGEMIALRGETIASGYGEWLTNGPGPAYDVARTLLHKSLTFQDPNYYVGIVCPCCQGMINFNNMKEISGQKEEALTYANIFVNSNYKYFKENYIEYFKNKKIILVANETSRRHLDNLPFAVQEFVGVSYNAWIKDLILVNVLKSYKLHDYIFLFACGPLGKILACELWEDNKNNTYLDIGSTLHPWLLSDINIRGYYQENSFHSNLTCTWGI
jgi:hypothetical protein